MQNILKFKFIFTYFIILFTTLSTTYSQSLLKSVAGKDYEQKSKEDSNYEIFVFDTILIIKDPEIEEMVFSLNSLNFIKRTNMFFDVKKYHDLYPIGSLDSGNTLIYLSFNGLWKFNISSLKNGGEFKEYILKDINFEVDYENTRSRFLEGPFLYINSKNLFDKKDTNYYLSCWDINNQKKIEITNSYIQKYQSIPEIKLSNNLYFQNMQTLVNLNNSKTYSTDSLNKSDKLSYKFELFTFIENENVILGYNEAVFKPDSLGFGVSPCVFILDTNLKKIDKFYVINKVDKYSYSQKDKLLFFINQENKFCVYDFKLKKLIDNYYIADKYSYSLPTNATYLKDDLVLISALQNHYTSYIYNYKTKEIVQYLHNDMFNVEKIEISNDDKYIAALGRNYSVMLYDSYFKPIACVKKSSVYRRSGYKDLGCDLKFSKNNELLIGGSYVFGSCYIVSTKSKKIIQSIDIDKCTTVDWDNIGDNFVLGTNDGKVYAYSKQDTSYVQSKSKVFPSGSRVFKVVYLDNDTIGIFVINLPNKIFKYIKWNVKTNTEKEVNLFNVQFGIAPNDSTSSKISMSKDKKYIYQDFNGELTLFNLNYNSNKVIKFTEYDFSPNGEISNVSLSKDNNMIFYTKISTQDQFAADTYLRMFNIQEKKNIEIDTNKFRFPNYWSSPMITTLQFCAYGLFNNSNKMVTGSFDGTLMLWDMNNIKMGVEYSEVQNPLVKIWNDESNIYLQNDSENNYDYKIFDLNYRVLQNDKLESNSSNSININDRLSNNIYFVLITNKKSNQSQIYKFIIRN